jgi:hypothetical protein
VLPGQASGGWSSAIGRRRLITLILAAAALHLGVRISSADDPVPQFRVGVAVRDITPEAMLPMWGYGARHSKPATGTLDPLFAKAIVIHAGGAKLALVGMDLGRGPTAAMMEQIRAAIARDAGIEHALISGSHTHHGPVIELTDREGYGKGRFDAAVAYAKDLSGRLIDVILEADKNAVPARMGIAKTTELDLNRNRQSRRKPKATDPMLAVMRFDDEGGRPIAVLVNFAAHPVMTEAGDLRYSADYPGFMTRSVEAALGGKCVFMQGAAGDMSPNPGPGGKGPKEFGEALGGHVVKLAQSIETARPEKPSVAGKVDRMEFASRIDFANPLVNLAYETAFFPELVHNFLAEMKHGIDAELNTVVLNGEVALVGGSGEFFCNHSGRLKERSYLPHTLFFGYCNGHSLYFPTIEAVSEGGYGADAYVSPVEIGAGERMMDRALINIYTLSGKLPAAGR